MEAGATTLFFVSGKVVILLSNHPLPDGEASRPEYVVPDPDVEFVMHLLDEAENRMAELEKLTYAILVNVRGLMRDR